MSNVEAFMRFAVEHRAPALCLQDLADVLHGLIWSLNEPTACEIARVRLAWMRGDDELLAEIALRMNETFPVETRAELEQLLAGVRTRLPRLGALCDGIMNQWDGQFGR